MSAQILVGPWSCGLWIPLAIVSACAPDTDLVGEGGGGTDSTPGSTTVGAAALVDPAPGTTDVPLNLAAVLVRFPTAVTVFDGALSITAAGQRAGAGLVAAMDCPQPGPGACFRLPLAGLLMPATTYVVAIGDGVVDGDGLSLGAGPVGQFVTASEADLVAPVIAGLTVEPSGPCVLVSFQTDEPAAATLVMEGAGVQRTIAAGAGATQFSAAASIAAFGAGTEVQIVARVMDLAGNLAASASVAVTVPVGLLPVAITEIRANPVGSEPGQEYVEIRNLGIDGVDVGGLSVEDSKGADVLPSTVLDPGAFALLVPAAFDPAGPGDTPPRPGTVLIRVDARIGSDGLTNGGEIVRLRNGDGITVSSYSALVDVSASKWAGKTVHRMPEDACDQPASWTRLPTDATPGWGTP